MATKGGPVRTICLCATVAALYTALTLLTQAISFGPVQLRVAEALTLLPVLFPPAGYGLALGCLLSNLLGSATPWDVVFGTLATLIAAMLTVRLRRNIWLAALPPVLVNAVVISLVLRFTLADALLLPTALSIAAGQAVAVYGLGVPLVKALEKLKIW